MARRESVDIPIKVEVDKFFRDYTREFPKLGDLYFGDPGSVDKYVEMSSDPYLRMIKRPRLHQALHDYNKSLGAPAAALENVDRLRYDGAYCVLAWQQPYILGGPLETLLKVLTALRLCEKLNATNAAKFVPVLWAHADDHELSEVNRVNLPVAAHLVEEKLEIDETERPSEAVETGEAYDALVGRLRKHLRDTPHKEWLLEAAAATKGASLGDHFARFMMRLFGEHGLVIACPSIFRPEISALMGRAIDNPEKIDRLLGEAKKTLEAKGYPCHTAWEDPLHLYRLSDGKPLRLRYKESKFTLDSTGGEMTPAQVSNEVKKWPQIYTNGVLLSPLEQDSCVPSVAHIAGPGGCEFFGVQKALFDDYRVAFPQVIPQVSATIVDARAAKGLKDLGKSFGQLITDARKAAEAAGNVPIDHLAALGVLRDDALKTIEGYIARNGAVAAEVSKIAVEIGALLERELRRLTDATKIGEARDKVLAALEKWGARALEVHKSAAAGLAEVRKRVEADLPAHLKPPLLGKTREDLEKAAKALAEAAKPAENAAAAKLHRELGSELNGLARATLEAAEKAAAANVPDSEVAKLLLTPESGLQEDTIGMFYFFNERGPGLVREVADALDVFDFRHQVVWLE